MRKVIAVLGLASVSAFAQNYNNPNNHQVQGYTRSNGTYVESYHATNPNSTTQDNYSNYGNTNPYTGQTGTHHSKTGW